MYQSKDPQRSAGVMPKRYLDHKQCEVMRFFKLQTKGLVEPVAMTVPRKVSAKSSHLCCFYFIFVILVVLALSTV